MEFPAMFDQATGYVSSKLNLLRVKPSCCETARSTAIIALKKPLLV
jgi:hypothetical protein